MGIRGVEGGVVLVGPDQAAHHVEGLLGVLLACQPKPPPMMEREIQVLQGIGGEIAGDECEEPGIDVVVVANAAAGSVGAGGGNGIGVFAVQGVDVERGLVRPGGAGSGETGAEGGGRGVARGRGPD